MAKKVSFDFTPKNCLTISVGTVAGRFNDRVSRRSLDLPEPQKRPKRSKNNLNNIPLCNFEFSSSGFPHSNDARVGISKKFCCSVYPIFIHTLALGYIIQNIDI